MIFNEEKINIDFKTKYKCNHNSSKLKEKLQNFIKNPKIQDSFFNVKTSDNAFNLLKQKEQKDLLEFFEHNKSSLDDFIRNQISQEQSFNYDYSNLIQSILEIENANEIYELKAKREIENINNNKKIFEIRYLTVMLVGKSGVGKSTLINNLLKLENFEKAKTGIGNFQTTKIAAYSSKSVPFLKLVDTRGIELDHNYGPAFVLRDAENYINEQYTTNDPNNFVQCIWYCITGDRFEDSEIELLNLLRSAYGDNKIPIIFVYTQASDINIINGMEKYIRDKNIYDVDFIRVVAERTKLIHGQDIKPFGLDILIKETLTKCKNTMLGEMRSVMTNKINNFVTNKIIEENSYIKKYIFEKTVLDFISNYNEVKNDNDFINYIINNILSNNIQYYLDKIISERSYGLFYESNIIKNINNIFIKSFFSFSNKIIELKLNDFAIDFLDYQVTIQKKEKSIIQINNKRRLKGFINTSQKFLNDNFYYILQIQYISNFIMNELGKCSNSFEQILNQVTKNIVLIPNIQDLIIKCFLKKFGDFEKRIS